MAESLRGIRLSRFYNYEQYVYVPAPTGGWNPDANPWELPDNQAPILDNFVIRPGRIAMRSPITQMVQLSAHFEPIGYVLGDHVVGSVQPNGWLSLSQKVRDATKIIDPWHAPLLAASAASLAAGGTTLTQVNLDAGLTNTTVLTADTVPGPRWINFDGLLYGISYDAVAAAVHDTNSNYFMKPLNLLTLPYIQSAATVPTVLGNAPHGAFDLKGYLSRIWLLGGVDTPGGLTAHEPTTIFYTIPGTSGVGTASADWKDPISGLVNKIRMDNNSADYGVGLGLVTNAMVIFRRNSVWSLRGTTSASFQIQPVSKTGGCLDARSIVETDHGIYFMSQQGLMFTDGVAVQNVSGNVQQQMLAAIRKVEGSIRQGTGGWYSCAMTSAGQILVSLGTSNAGASGATVPVWTGLYDPALNVWTRITSGLWTADNPSSLTLPPLLVMRPDRHQLYAVGDGQVTMLENTQGSFVVPTVGFGLYDIGQTDPPIPAQWRSKVLTVIGTGTRKVAQASRYIVDYAFGTIISTPIAQGWHVQLLDSSDNTIDTAIDLAATNTQNSSPVSMEPVTFPRIQRQNQDCTVELSDVMFDVSWSFTYPGSPLLQCRADIYGIAVELQHARDAR